MSIKKEDIKSVIGGLFDLADKENKEAYQAVAAIPAISEAMRSATDGQYEEFYFTLLYPISGAIDGLLASVTKSTEARFLLKHSDFVESHIEKLIEKYEGAACCADKSRTILKSLLRFYMEDIKIAFNYEQQYTYTYHLPKKIFKTHDDIVSFFNGLHNLYYGNPDLYLLALRGVVETVNNQTKPEAA